MRIGTGLFLVAGVLALLVTLGGIRALMDQVVAAPNGTAELITLVIGFGLVLLGPVLLLALALLTPRQWMPGFVERIITSVERSDGRRQGHGQPSHR